MSIEVGLDQNDAELRQIRIDIASLIEALISSWQKNNGLGLWEKDSIIQAMTALNWDWLHLSVACIDHAILDQRNRSDAYPTNKARSDEISKITEHDLLQIIGKIKTQM